MPSTRERVVLAIDHGSTGVRTALCTTQGRILASAERRTPTERLPDGGVELDPMTWWQAFLEGARELLGLGLVQPEQLLAVACSSTFSTTVACAEDGAPLGRALSWQDARGAPHVRDLMGGRFEVHGYALDKVARWIPIAGGAPTLSGKDDAAHLLYWRHERPEVWERARWFLGSKDWFNLMLCGRAAASFDSAALFWVSDNRDAARVRYHEGLARLLGFDLDRLGPLVPATAVLGPLRPEVAAALGLPLRLPVVAGSADLQSACIGSGAVRDFEAHLYLGTSSWLLCHVPWKHTDPLHAITSLPSSIPGRWFAANEQDMACGSVDWFIRTLLYPPGPLGRGEPPADVHARLDEVLERGEPRLGGPIFTPWLNGEKTPVDDERLRGGFHNLSLGTDLDQMVRAVFEGVALNTRWLLLHQERFVGRRLDPIRVIGGGARSAPWCQVFADVLGREVHRVEEPRLANARGAALIAAVALGDLSFDRIPGLVPVERRFLPRSERAPCYDELFHAFRLIHARNRGIHHRLNAR